jgi:hypothetical protein
LAILVHRLSSLPKYQLRAAVSERSLATPLGVAAILIGAFLSIYAAGTGLIVGGMASVAFGYFGYWQHLDDRVRFVSLLASFAILRFVSYRRMAGG